MQARRDVVSPRVRIRRGNQTHLAGHITDELRQAGLANIYTAFTPA